MTNGQRLSQDTGEPFARITPDEAKKLIDAGGVQVVDTRRPDEYVRGHVPGAKLIPVDEFFARSSEVDSEKPALFICATGVRSALTCEMAAALGFDPARLYNVETGTEGWIAHKYPVNTGMEP